MATRKLSAQEKAQLDKDNQALKFDNSMKGQKTLERVLQKQCTGLLISAGNVFVHVPNEGKRSKIANIELIRQGLQKGFPDLCIFDLKAVIELKTRYEKPSQDQVLWLNKFRSMGWSAYWVNSFDEFIALYKSLTK